MDVIDIDPADVAVVRACANLAERSGAKSFQIAHTDPAADPVTWSATATYPNHQLTEAGYEDPIGASMALSHRILTGAKCKCGGLVALSVVGAFAPPATATMFDGSDPLALRDADQCLWVLEGERWESGCNAPPLTIAPAGESAT